MSFSSREKKNKQTHISLDPLHSSSPGASELNEQLQSRAAAVRFGADGSPSKKRRVLLPPSSGQTRLDFSPKNQPSNPSSSSDEEDAIVDPRTRSSRQARPSKDKQSFSDATRTRNKKSNPPEDALKSTRIKRGQKSQVKAGKRSIVISSGEDSEPISVRSARPRAQKQEDYPRTPQSSRRPPSSSSRRALQYIAGGSIGAAPIRSSREQYIATPTRSSKRMPASEQRRHSHPDESPSLSRRSSQESNAESDDSDDSLMNDLKKSAPKSRKPSRDQEITSGSPIKVSRFRKKPSRRTRSPSVGEPEASESGSDSENNQNTPQAGRGARTRPKRPDTKKLTFKKHLELLQQRRSGKEVEPVPDDLDIGSPNEDSQVAETHSGNSSDSDEFDFVVDDDDDTVGAPAALVGMPIQFTRHALKKPVEHFRDVVEWMIHNKLNPAFGRNNEVYVIAIQKLDDAAQALVGSKFISAAWNAEFSGALKKYPELESIEIPMSPDNDQTCEACKRSGHPAKHRLIFSGKPYDRNSLESEEDFDDTGEPLPGKMNKTVFLLGSNCNANAQTAHALQHWRHALNDDVLEYLQTKGHLEEDKILQRADWGAKRRERYANAVVDEMEADDWMHMRYREFKDNMNAARSDTNKNSRRHR
ncbi:hypothetical protein Q9189_007689 [Teloschistes chrysophthalmus]